MWRRTLIDPDDPCPPLTPSVPADRHRLDVEELMRRNVGILARAAEAEARAGRSRRASAADAASATTATLFET